MRCAPCTGEGWRCTWSPGSRRSGCSRSWFFRSREDADGSALQAAIAARQARLRAAIADMLWRSKYALLIVVFFAALVLLMDQTRDALLRQIADAGSGDAVFPTIVGVAVTIFALVMLSRASWLWPRMILRLRSPEPGEWSTPASEAFAKWWCRVLGLVPYFVVAVMIARTFHDVPWNDAVTKWFVLTLALILFAAIGFFYRVSNRLPPGVDSPGYYDCADNEESALHDVGVMTSIVIWGPPATFLLARFLGLMQWTPPLALAVITAGLATWAGLLGWVAYQSRRHAIPYLVLFAVVVGALGVLDWTDTHRMRLWADDFVALDAAALRMLFAIAVVLAVIGLALSWFWDRKYVSGLARIVSAVVALLAVAVLIKFHDAVPGAPADPATRPDAQAALSGWINQLPADAFRPAGAARPEDRYPVFLVASEGGGIRSAYWTAVVLWRMQSASPTSTGGRSRFPEARVARSASRSTGRAARANATSDSIKACIDRFGYSDMWTQLMGGMFFEDAVATILPTAFCRQPGCGVLGRSWWFEGAIEAAVPAWRGGFRRRLALGRPAAVPVPQRDTRRDGRACDRERRADRRTGVFPDAVDLLAVANADVPLSTAAHNSGRFPYTNPVAAVYGPTCPQDPRDGEPVPAKRRPGLCMRLQDAGYFDNSGALTAANLLRAIDGCTGDPACAKPNARGTLWIKPVLIEIRNEDAFRIPPDRNWPSACTTPAEWPYNPQRPDIKGPEVFFPSVLSAPLDDLQHAHRACARLRGRARERRPRRMDPGRHGPAGEGPRCVRAPQGLDRYATRHRFDLVDDGTLYPSGWLLSTRAMAGIFARAVRDARPGPTPAEAKDAACAPKVARKW